MPQVFQLEQFKDQLEVCVWCSDKRLKQEAELVEKILEFMLRDWVKLRVICKAEEKNKTVGNLITFNIQEEGRRINKVKRRKGKAVEELRRKPKESCLQKVKSMKTSENRVVNCARAAITKMRRFPRTEVGQDAEITHQLSFQECEGENKPNHRLVS